MRDSKAIESFLKQTQKKLKEMNLFKLLKKEVNTGANGTQDYVIKEGVNKNKIASIKWKNLKVLVGQDTQWLVWS